MSPGSSWAMRVPSVRKEADLVRGERQQVELAVVRQLVDERDEVPVRIDVRLFGQVGVEAEDVEPLGVEKDKKGIGLLLPKLPIFDEISQRCEPLFSLPSGEVSSILKLLNRSIDEIAKAEGIGANFASGAFGRHH